MIEKHTGLSRVSRTRVLSARVITALCAAATTACITPYTAPRSEVIQEAEEQGLNPSSVEADRQRFFALETEQRRRLEALLAERAGETVAADYRIGGGDILEINVFDVPDLNVTREVSQSGFVALPLLSSAKLDGLTVAEAESTLRERLRKYIKDPQVSVHVTAYGSQQVSVMGAVPKPGSYPLRKGSNDLLEIVGQAGGASPDAGNFLTLIPEGAKNSAALADPALVTDTARRESLRSKGVEIALRELYGTDGGLPVKVPVRGGDLIIVSKAGNVMVDGEVNNKGSYQLAGRMSVLGALAAAGGITYQAKVDEVEILRDAPGDEKVRLVLDLQKFARGEQKDVLLRDGDVLIVPTDSGKRVTKSTFDGITRIINFGVGGTVDVAR